MGSIRRLCSNCKHHEKHISDYPCGWCSMVTKNKFEAKGEDEVGRICENCKYEKTHYNNQPCISCYDSKSKLKFEAKEEGEMGEAKEEPSYVNVTEVKTYTFKQLTFVSGYVLRIRRKNSLVAQLVLVNSATEKELVLLTAWDDKITVTPQEVENGEVKILKIIKTGDE